MIDLSQRVALVTGGSRGIGRASALRLAEAGADVIVNYVVNRTAAEEVAESVRSLGRAAAVVKADVSEPDDIAAMMGFVRERFGRLDVLVSNAATGGFRSLEDVGERQFDTAMHTNVLALLHLVRSGKDLLERSEGRSKVIALSSHGSRMALPAYGVVGTSKAALESLIRQMAYEWGDVGVNFNVVLAGLVETDTIRNLPDAAGLVDANQERMLVSDLRLTPERVADVVLYLASSLSDLIQGQTLVVDGGVGIRG